MSNTNYNNKNKLKCNPEGNTPITNCPTPFKNGNSGNNGSNDSSYPNSFRYSKLSQNPAGHSSTIQYPKGDLISHLNVIERTPDSLTISFVPVTQSFTNYVLHTTLPDGFSQTVRFSNKTEYKILK